MKITYEVLNLPNGARVLLIPSDTVNSISMNATFKSGSALENKKNQGITHFVEHMALTCTKKWPTKATLNEIVEFNGGRTNGETDQEYLDYSINIPDRKLAFGIDYLYEVLYNSQFEDKNLEIERTIILDEISKYDDNVYYKAGEFIDNSLLKNKSAYAFDIAGTNQTVKSFTKQQLVDHYKISHTPNRLLLSIVGNFDVAEAKKLINDYFLSVEKGEAAPNYPDECLYNGIIASKSSKKSDLIIAENVFTYEGISAIKHDIKIPSIASFTSKILSGPMSSRLMKRLREKEGLLYGIHCGVHTKIPYGKIHISYEVKPEFYEKTLKILTEELNNFYTNGITSKELEHYREYLVNRLIVRYDNIYSHAHMIKTHVFFDEEVITVETLLDIMKSITVQDINGFITKYLNPKQGCYFAYGNVSKDTTEMMKAVVR